jgi:hypothetical protein
MQKIENLNVSQVDKERADRTCGPYYFLVCIGGMSFTAFRTKYGFLRWLRSRGLKLTEPLVPVGETRFQRIKGHYYERSLPIPEFETFDNSDHDGRRIYKLNNGRYLPAVVSRNPEDGAVIVTYPHSGFGEEPSIQFWKGVAIEDGTCFKRVEPAPGPEWLTASPEELIAKAESLPEDSLGEVEKAMMVSSWIKLADKSLDTPPLNNRGLFKEMTFG